jgi:hypothetical protein
MQGTALWSVASKVVSLDCVHIYVCPLGGPADVHTYNNNNNNTAHSEGISIMGIWALFSRIKSIGWRHNSRVYEYPQGHHVINQVRDGIYLYDDNLSIYYNRKLSPPPLGISLHVITLGQNTVAPHAYRLNARYTYTHLHMYDMAMQYRITNSW